MKATACFVIDPKRRSRSVVLRKVPWGYGVPTFTDEGDTVSACLGGARRATCESTQMGLVMRWSHQQSLLSLRRAARARKPT